MELDLVPSHPSPPANEPDVAEDEPTALDYARLYGLCRDYTFDQPDISNLRAPSDDDIAAAIDLPLTNPANELTKERLTVTKDAALLLKTVFSMQQPPEDTNPPHKSWRRTALLKQEVPLLRTDNELELEQFGSTETPSFANLQIPMEVVNEENDEGLQWPSKYDLYPLTWNSKAKTEKLAVSKDILLFLQNAVRDPWTSADAEKIKNECFSYARNPSLLPVTPPLLPISPPLTPYVPSSPGNRLEPLSESSNSTAGELKALDERIMREDALLPVLETLTSDDSMLLDGFESFQGSAVKQPSPVMKRKRDDLKVEGPLTPSIFSESPTKKMKSVTFREMIREYIPELPSTFESGNAILSEGDSFAEFYKHAAPLAEELNRKVENEKLSEVDTTKRVDVPRIDFIQPVAPWDEFGGADPNAQRKFLHRVQLRYLATESKWHGLSKLERELGWAGFPIHMGTVTIQEKLHGEEVLNKLLAELTMGDIATSSTDIWKRDGLRILEDDDSEDDLEVADFQPEPAGTLESTIKKRKLEMEDDPPHRERKAHILGPKPAQRAHHHGGSRQGSAKPAKKEESDNTRKQSDNSLMFGGTFSASTALMKFMETQGKPIAEPKDNNQSSAHFPPPVPSLTSLPVRPTQIPQAVVPQRTPTPPPALPALPSIPHHLPACSFVISTTFLQQRTLAREVEKIYANAQFIERDFSLPHSPSNEADLLISPSTGLILTTLQQIKQRPLPGQPDRSPIEKRVINLQSRYERLVILISEGLSRQAEEMGSGRPVDSRDQGALAEFEKFTAKMDADVLGTYVRGGELALARTIVGEMVKWGLPHGSKDIGDLKLLQDETTWEVFLRRAGLNPFAAQVILYSLRGAYDMPLETSSSGLSDAPGRVIHVESLPALVLMSAEERVERFQVLLGGGRVLARVNAALDRKWPSAANGFQM